LCAPGSSASNSAADGEAWLDSVLQTQDGVLSGTVDGVPAIPETTSVANAEIGAEMERWLALVGVPGDGDIELGLEHQWTLPTGVTGLDELMPGVGVF